MPWQPKACSGARYSALPHCSRPLPSASGHLGPPPRVPRSRLGVRDTLRGRPPPPYPSSCLLSHAHRPPERSSEHAHTRDAPDPPCSLSSLPWLWTESRNAPDTFMRALTAPGLARDLAGAWPRWAPRPFYLKPPKPPLCASFALSLSRMPPGPTHSPSRALHRSPWPEQSRRTPPKYAPLSPPPSLWTALGHHHHHLEPLPCFSLSSRWPWRRNRRRRG